MQTETRQSGAIFKAGEGQFVRCNEAKPDKRNRQGVPMKQRDAEQRQRKQDEFGWNPVAKPGGIASSRPSRPQMTYARGNPAYSSSCLRTLLSRNPAPTMRKI
jgi:hypothetical protein